MGYCKPDNEMHHSCGCVFGWVCGWVGVWVSVCVFVCLCVFVRVRVRECDCMCVGYCETNQMRVCDQLLYDCDIEPLSLWILHLSLSLFLSLKHFLLLNRTYTYINPISFLFNLFPSTEGSSKLSTYDRLFCLFRSHCTFKKVFIFILNFNQSWY